MTFKRVVSIGAHSLDAELMGGPLLIKYAKEGAHVSCLHVTQGRLEDPNATEEQKQAYLKSLLDQNRRAAEVLGGDSLWLGYVSSNMPSTEEFAKRLEQYFIDENVDLVTCSRYRDTGEKIKKIINVQKTSNPLDLSLISNYTCDKLFKKEIIDKNNIMFPEKYRYAEDLYFLTTYRCYSNEMKIIENPF